MNAFMSGPDYTNLRFENDPYIDVVCLSCFKDMKVPVRFAGTTGKCNSCGAKIDVPHVSGATAQPRPVQKNLPKAAESSVGYRATIYEGIRDRWQFLGSLLVAGSIGSIWTFILGSEDMGRLLFPVFAVLSVLLVASVLFFVFGGKSASRIYTRWGLNEEFRRNLPLDALNIMLGVLCLTHFIPIAPFLFNGMGLYRYPLTAHELAVNFLYFGMFPLAGHSFLRRGNRLALGVTTLGFAAIFIGTYFYVASTSNISGFNVNYFVEIRGFAPFLYWGLSGIIYVLAMAALYVCWKDADK